MKRLTIAIAILLSGLRSTQAQTADAGNAIDKLVRDAGSRQEGVNHIAPPAHEQSAAVDDWIARNRVSIEGTRGGPFDPTPQYVTTSTGNRIYVHILDWNKKNNVALPSVIDRPIRKAWLLESETSVRVDSSLGAYRCSARGAASKQDRYRRGVGNGRRRRGAARTSHCGCYSVPAGSSYGRHRETERPCSLQPGARLDRGMGEHIGFDCLEGEDAIGGTVLPGYDLFLRSGLRGREN